MSSVLAADSALVPAAPRRTPLVWIAVVWTLFGLWCGQQTLLLNISSGQVVQSWVRPFAVWLASAWFWALITPLLMWITRSLRDRVSSRPRRIGLHIITYLVVHVGDVLYYTGMTAIFGWQPTRPWLQLVFSLASLTALMYLLVVIVTAALDYHDAFRERAVHVARLETQLAQAQFHALRAQLHPHFLFNSLNAISALMHKDVNRADRMLARLSELLRMAIDTATTAEIRLIDEIEFVKRYLETEQMRFGDRLDVRIELPVETYDALVPAMLLQPLVENAVRHGVAPHTGPARVEVRVQRNGSSLGIVVTDSGGSCPESIARRDPASVSAECLSVNEGVGLRTSRERLARLYGDAQELVLANVPGGGFESRVTIPFHVRADAQSPVLVPAAGR